MRWWKIYLKREKGERLIMTCTMLALRKIYIAQFDKDWLCLIISGIHTKLIDLLTFCLKASVLHVFMFVNTNVFLSRKLIMWHLFKKIKLFFKYQYIDLLFKNVDDLSSCRKYWKKYRKMNIYCWIFFS